MNTNASTVEIPRNARQWAMICHLSALSGLLGNGIGFLLGPLIVWLIKREDHPFINKQGKEAVNFQITMFIVLFISAILCLLLIGFAFLIVVAFLMTIFPIIAAVRSNNGEDYKYPVSLRFIK
ncbi:MAG: DUF4870 domain-containing protein [Candidatus Eisenbacteria bacterium]|nr:DUF4870 domain-containing protein [Candidatus Eisenbacteria bacterium]